MSKRVTAGPFTLVLPPNGVALLYEADEAGNETQLPGGVGYLDALIQFAGEIIRLRAYIDALEEKLRLANTGSLSLLYDIRRELGWNDKTSLDMLADGVRRVRRALQTWDTPSGLDLEALAMTVAARVVDLEAMNVENKARIDELLEELLGTGEKDDYL